MSYIIVYFLATFSLLVFSFYKVNNTSKWVLKNFDESNEVDSKIREEMIRNQIKQLDTYGLIGFLLFLVSIAFFLFVAFDLYSLIGEDDVIKLIQNNKMILSFLDVPVAGASLRVFFKCISLKKEYLISKS